MPLYSPTKLSITGNTGGTPLLVGDVIYLSGGNNITLNQTNQTLEIVGAAGAGGAADGFNRISAGTQIAATLATVVFSNSNNITFGMTNNSIITASASFNQTVESQSLGMSNLGNTSGTTGIASGGQVRFLFVGGNNVTLSQSLNGASGTITISAFNSVAPTGISSIVGSDATYTSGSVQFTGSNIVTVKSSANQRIVIDASQTNQTLGLYAVGNTTGESSSSTFDARTISYKGLGIASVGYSGGTILISVPSGGGAGDGVNILAAGTQTANTTGTVLFDNANGITFGMNNSSVITASHSVPVVSNGILDVNTATGSGTATSRFAAHDHVHRGVAGVDVNGIASTFYGTVQLSAGNLMSIATGGNSTRGSIQLINLLSSATTVSSVGSVNDIGAMVSRFALEGHIHGGVGAIGVSSDGDGNTGSKHGTWWFSENGNVSLSVQTSNNGSNTLYISAGGNFSAGMSNVGNTAGSSGTVSGQMVFVGSQGFALSQSTNGASGTLSIIPARQSFIENMPFGAMQATNYLIGNFNKSILLFPFPINGGGLSAKTIRSYGSRTGGVSLVATANLGFYTMANSTALSLVSSTSVGYSLTASTQWRSVRVYDITGLSNLNLTGIQTYFIGVNWSFVNAGVGFLGPATFPQAIIGSVNPGTDNTAGTATSDHLTPFFGAFSATSAGLPNQIGRSEIVGGNEISIITPYMAIMEI